MLIIYIFGLLSAIAEGYPTGAPLHSCTNLLPHHHGTSPQAPPAPYTFAVSSSTYTPGTPLIVSIFGSPDFLAFLLQGKRKDSNAAVGKFIEIPDNTKFMTCEIDHDSVTHSNPMPRNITQFKWMPPQIDVGDIVFKGAVARSRSLYYGVLESPTLKYSQTADSGSRVTIPPVKENNRGHLDGSGSSKQTSGCLSILLLVTCIISLVNLLSYR